jgi:hypothetical protein
MRRMIPAPLSHELRFEETSNGRRIPLESAARFSHMRRFWTMMSCQQRQLPHIVEDSIPETARITISGFSMNAEWSKRAELAESMDQACLIAGTPEKFRETGVDV